jgi:hypothetical protein
MAELVSRARDVVHIFEGEEVSAATDYFSERIRLYLDQGWSLEDHIRDVWRPALADLAGSSRRISEEVQLSTTAVRFTLEGDRGRAFVTISFDDDGGVGGFGIERHVFEGIGNVVIMCPYERVQEMDAFYKSLLGADRWRVPRFAFGEADEYHREPRWGDPDYPQQLHFDIFVQDLPAAESIALRGGAKLLEENDGHRSYADPVGHQFDFCSTSSSDARVDQPPGVLGRIVVDCFSPRALAPFYEELLGMPNRIEDTSGLVVIAREDGSLPMLAFQQVTPFVAPRWPDPAYPAQMHFDLKFYDRENARDIAERLGAIRLPDQGGSCPVYADPSGHPFCLCMHGE